MTVANDKEFIDLKPLYDVIDPAELTQLTISSNAALAKIEGLAGLGALTQLTISDNARWRGSRGWPAWARSPSSRSPDNRSAGEDRGAGRPGRAHPAQDLRQPPRWRGSRGWPAWARSPSSRSPATPRWRGSRGWPAWARSPSSGSPATPRWRGSRGWPAWARSPSSRSPATTRWRGSRGWPAWARSPSSRSPTTTRWRGSRGWPAWARSPSSRSTTTTRWRGSRGWPISRRSRSCGSKARSCRRRWPRSRSCRRSAGSCCPSSFSARASASIGPRRCRRSRSATLTQIRVPGGRTGSRAGRSRGSRVACGARFWRLHASDSQLQPARRRGHRHGSTIKFAFHQHYSHPRNNWRCLGLYCQFAGKICHNLVDRRLIRINPIDATGYTLLRCATFESSMRHVGHTENISCATCCQPSPTTDDLN